MKFINYISYKIPVSSPAAALMRPGKGANEGVAGKVPCSWPLAATDLRAEALELAKGFSRFLSQR